jgi:uncharacterized Rmd1/YagE family protein
MPRLLDEEEVFQVFNFSSYRNSIVVLLVSKELRNEGFSEVFLSSFGSMAFWKFSLSPGLQIHIKLFLIFQQTNI